MRTQPLAGTCALTDNDSESRELGDTLLQDPKEIYEHALSAKFAFDELQAVSMPESVRIRDFMAMKQRGSVQHLGSTVEGQLREGLDHWDALTAVFPAVTASGVPKREALEVIRELEGQDRDLYAGAVLMDDHAGALDSALVLRTLFRSECTTWMQAGAGIVSESTPERELEESREKMRSIAPYVIPLRGPSVGMLIPPAGNQ